MGATLRTIPADPHNPMMDSKGRVWTTSKIRGNAGARVVQRCDARQQVRRLVPAHEQRPSGVVLRSENAEVAVDRNLLQHAPSAVRQRCRRDGVLQRTERSDLRLGRHEGLRQDARRRRKTKSRRNRPRSAGADRSSTPTATERSRKPWNRADRPAAQRSSCPVPGRHGRTARRRRGAAAAGGDGERCCRSGSEAAALQRRRSIRSSTRWSATTCIP